MKFLLDENVHHGLIKVLKRLGHEARLSPKGFTNGKVLALAISKKKILITHDSDFSDRIFPNSHSGIILVKIPSKFLDALTASMTRLLSAKTDPLDFIDKLFILTESGFDEYPFAFQEFKS